MARQSGAALPLGRLGARRPSGRSAESATGPPPDCCHKARDQGKAGAGEYKGQDVGDEAVDAMAARIIVVKQ